MFRPILSLDTNVNLNLIEKDNWDDEEAPPAEVEDKPKAIQVPKKKKIGELLAEKEAKTKQKIMYI